MEPDWPVLLLVLLAIVTIIVFFVSRNQKDKAALLLKLNKENIESTQDPEDTEVVPNRTLK